MLGKFFEEISAASIIPVAFLIVIVSDNPRKAPLVLIGISLT